MPTGTRFPHDWTVDDLTAFADRLGVPPSRIRMDPRPGTVTVDDVIEINDRKRTALCELIDGTLVEKPVGMPESLIAGLLAYLLNAFVLPRKFGLILGPDATLRLSPDQVRLPDVSFVGNDRLKNGRLPKGQAPELVPHLAVEVLSPSNTRKEMERKLKEYFFASVLLVWLIDPDTRTAQVFASPDEMTEVPATGALDGGSVLPGFSLPLADLFDGSPED